MKNSNIISKILDLLALFIRSVSYLAMIVGSIMFCIIIYKTYIWMYGEVELRVFLGLFTIVGFCFLGLWAFNR